MDAIDKISKVNAWRKGDKRAPHKPLLMLFAIAQLHRGEKQNPFQVVDEHLSKLLETFGPPNPTSPTYPFLRLANDGIWQVDGVQEINTTKDYGKGALKKLDAIGSFTPEMIELLNSDEKRNRAIEYLLNQNFPESLHEDILSAIGYEFAESRGKKNYKRRDPEFRTKVLEAYERKCAICGFQVRRDDQVIGVEAAHIKWHQAGGPDVEQNGIAMCVMHHKMFDYGLFAIEENLRVKVSTKANGGYGLKEWLLRFHNQKLNKPVKNIYYPEPEFVKWQVNEVFKGVYRD